MSHVPNYAWMVYLLCVVRRISEIVHKEKDITLQSWLLAYLLPVKKHRIEIDAISSINKWTYHTVAAPGRHCHCFLSTQILYYCLKRTAPSNIPLDIFGEATIFRVKDRRIPKLTADLYHHRY